MPQLGLGLSAAKTKSIGFDRNALAYLTAVEAADGQALENSVKVAINTFVVGCKSDGVWDAITNACIMAGARSVAGAIVPLKGTAPTNTGFVIGDYSRKTGLLGDASTKYLLTGYNNSDFPTDNVHLSCYVTQAPSVSANRMFIGQATGIGGRIWLQCNTASALNIKNRISLTAGVSITSEGTTTGFKGHSRSSSTNTIIRSSQTNTTNATSSTTLVAGAIGVFYDGAGTKQSDARMSFFSMGTNLNLALLDSRITTLMTTLGNIL